MPRLFISYHRSDTAHAAGRLHDRLIAAAGSDNVFMDIESIAGGEPFAIVIRDHIERSDFFFFYWAKIGWALKMAHKRREFSIRTIG